MQKFLLISSITSFLLSPSTIAEDWKTISSADYPGSQKFLSQDYASWRVDANSIPENDLGLDSPLRSMIFSQDQIKLRYNNLKLGQYKVKLKFLSDDAQRYVRIYINNKLAREAFQLNPKKPSEVSIKIPQSFIKNDSFQLSIEKASGPNTILSTAELLSTNGGLKVAAKLETTGNKTTISGQLLDINNNTQLAQSPIQVDFQSFGQVNAKTDDNGQFKIDLPTDLATKPDTTISISSLQYPEIKTQTVLAKELFSNKSFRNVLDHNTQDPFELCITNNGRIFYIERLGSIKEVFPSSKASKVIGKIDVYARLDDGLIGIAADPGFDKNSWLYLCYSTKKSSHNNVSRFTVKDGELDFNSEKVLLQIPVQRDTPPCHTGGSLAFDSAGRLFISTGDNINPFQSNGYAPIDERKGKEAWDAQASSGDSNDLRGKILRIKPEDDGTYSIPEGNLFVKGQAKTRAEIYVMGCRNPFRISVDQEDNTLYWGEVGPDAKSDNPKRGFRGHDEINQAKVAGNYGWPYFVADNKAYVDFDFSNNQSGESFVSDNIVNNSINNKGIQNLPPAQKSFISYSSVKSSQFPELKSGGRCAMSGPVYHFDKKLQSAYKLNSEYDNCLFIYDWMRGWVIAVKMDENKNIVELKRYAENVKFKRPMDLEIGPDGALYLLEWGSNYGGSSKDSQLSRIEQGVKISALKHNLKKDAQSLDKKRAQVLKLKGDAKRGAEIYHKNPKAACVYCHRIKDKGGIIGPKLDALGKRNKREEILDSIIFPNKQVADVYLPLSITMAEGKIYNGTKKSTDAHSIILNTAEGEVKLSLSKIKKTQKGQSGMPSGYGQSLNSQELADLTQYLLSL